MAHKSLLIISLFLLFAFEGRGQQIDRFNPDTIKTIQLDSVVNIRASRLNVETFIKAIVTDTSFYQAFRNMKKYNFLAENRIFTYNKEDQVNGRIFRRIKHHNTGPQKLEYLVKQDSGKVFKKNGKYDLYTLELFDYIFMNAYKSEYADGTFGSKAPDGKNGSYKDKLKTEIFSDNMRQYYDYSIYSATYLDSIPVYRFKVVVKPDLSSWTKDGLMIKELTTIFDKRNFEILGRYVDMKYSNMLFDFDVQMNIEMSYSDAVKLPTKITYQGNWNVPLKKEERASFLIVHKDYTSGK
jgi:hypothetical protein